MKYEIKKENKNDISNLFSGHSGERSFQTSEQIWYSTQCDYIISSPGMPTIYSVHLEHNLKIQNILKRP